MLVPRSFLRENVYRKWSLFHCNEPKQKKTKKQKNKDSKKMIKKSQSEIRLRNENEFPKNVAYINRSIERRLDNRANLETVTVSIPC